MFFKKILNKNFHRNTFPGRCISLIRQAPREDTHSGELGFMSPVYPRDRETVTWTSLVWPAASKPS